MFVNFYSLKISTILQVLSAVMFENNCLVLGFDFSKSKIVCHLQ